MAKIPFGLLPGSWGISGKTRKIAEAEYYYSGYELDKELAKINCDDDITKLQQLLLDVELKHKKIDQYTYDKNSVECLTLGSSEKDIKLLDVDLKHEKITQLEYDKKKADILKEPWVSMPTIKWDPNNDGKTYFEIDYNDYFLPFLKENGYVGNEDDIINKWLNDVCISVLEDINGIDADMATPTRRLRTEE